jgi:hypothetical protein
MMKKVVMVMCLLAATVFLTACESQDKVKEQELIGQTPHERHDTGIDSQVSDY